MHLLDSDVEPTQIPFLCFTHMHADHDLGLAPLVHYWRIVNNKDLSGLTIIGPKATLEGTVNRMMNFVYYGADVSRFITKMPQLLPVERNGEIQIPGFSIRYMDSYHSTPGLCYRIQDTQTGHTIGLSGDTQYMDSLPEFFSHVDLLVHECSFGAGPVDPVANQACHHSSALEAARVCQEAQVSRLLLTHTFAPKRDAALAAARERLGIPVEWAQPYCVFPF